MSTVTEQAAPDRKVLSILTTEQEHDLLEQAAQREHSSLSSFVLRSALNAAQSYASVVHRDRSTRTPETIEAAIRHAQGIMSKYRRPGHSLVDEFLAEKRAEAAREKY